MVDRFVGRRAELDQLLACQREAAAGRPRLVLVEAEAGFGKTALLGAFEPALSGCPLLRAPGYEDESRLPFGLLGRLLSGVEAVGVRDVGSVAGSGELTDPFAFGALLVQALGELQESGPAAVVVDDAPFGDSGSLQALTFAVRRLRVDRVLVVLTLRPEDAPRLPPGLVRLADEEGARIRLGGLSPDDAVELGESLGVDGLSWRAAERLCEHTGGSPLHLRALLTELPVEELRRTRGPLPTPRSYGPVILAGLAGCPEPARRLLSAAAVLGDGCDLTQAAAVAKVDHPLQAVQDASATHLIDVSDRGDGWQVAFRHSLIRRAVYDDLGPATRSQLHTRAAEVVGGQDALDHRTAAAQGADPELVSLLVERARSDAGSGAPARAADRLLAAVRLCAPGEGRDALRLDAVDMLLDAGEVREAAQFGDQLGTMPDSARRRLVQAKLAWMSGQPDAAETLARSAWDMGGDVGVRVAAAMMLAQLKILQDDGVGAARWAERVLRGGTLPEELASTARAIQADGLTNSGHPDLALRVLASLPEDPSDVPVGRLVELSIRAAVRMQMDQLELALHDGRALVGRNLSPHALAGLAYLADTEYRIGAWDDSVVHAEQSVSLARDTDQVWLAAVTHALAALVPAARGMWAEAQAHVNAAVAAGAAAGEAGRGFAANSAVHLAFCRGDPAAVVAAAEPLRSVDLRTPHEPGLIQWAEHTASALVSLRRFDEAEPMLDRMEVTGEARGRRSTLAGVARVRAQLGLARHDSSAARTCLESAIALGEGAAAVLDQARSRTAYGAVLRRTGQRRAAAEQLQLGREVFARLGAEPFVARCDQELLACGLPVVHRAPAPDAQLTRQERVVARLVCRGLTNREIADELVVSVKTVGYHLGNAYTKLGVHSRTQLAARLQQPGGET